MTAKLAQVIDLARVAQSARIDGDGLTFADIEAADARESRARNLRAAQPAITDADARAIVWRRCERTDAVNTVEKWWGGNMPILLLLGSVGRGKTVAAARLLAEHRGRYEHARDVCRVMAATFSDDVRHADMMLAAHLLVVDDVGTESDAARMTGALTRVVDARRSGGRRTMIISNHDRRAFAKTYPDERLHSRLAQAAMVVVDAGQDLRRRK